MALEVQVAGLLQVHAAAVDDRLQVALLDAVDRGVRHERPHYGMRGLACKGLVHFVLPPADRKSTRLNSSHSQISYAVFCLKKKKQIDTAHTNTAQLILVSKCSVEYT